MSWVDLPFKASCSPSPGAPRSLGSTCNWLTSMFFGPPYFSNTTMVR
ncbi:hypothetical protein [Massilia sp. LXY-6]